MSKHEVAVELAGGKRLVFETGRMAKQASGAALVTTGETVVLATAVASPDPREGIDFFPLTVDYREYTYAGGRIPGGFIKREGRPSEKEVLTCRQIDRPIRPLFPDGFRNETQVIALVFSADKENDPDVVGINAAAARWRSPTFPSAPRWAPCAWAAWMASSSSTPPMPSAPPPPSTSWSSATRTAS
jgi:polyribonucleotide nucleotidyltransferase